MAKGDFWRIGRGAWPPCPSLNPPLTSLLFIWYAVFVVLMKNATINNAGVKFTRYKTWGCLD